MTPKEHTENTSRCRVCILSETYYPQMGGTPTQARALAKGLKGAGWRPFVITRRYRSEYPVSEEVDGVPVYRIGPLGEGTLKKWGMLCTAFMALIRFRGEFEIIYVPGFRVLGIAAMMVASLLGKRTVFRAVSCGEMSGKFFESGLEGKPAFLRCLFRGFNRFRIALLRRADAFVAISSAVNAELLAAGVSRNKIFRISNGIDLEVYHPVEVKRKRTLRRELGLPEDSFIAMYTGRLVRYKGLVTLMEAWRKVSADIEGGKLVLIGEGSNDMHNCEHDLKSRVESSGMSDQVCFVGRIHNVESYLKSADLFVFPTEDEAFGISLVEAMACGLPVVSTDEGGIKDFLKDGKNGLIVGKQDADALAAAIFEVYTDADLRSRLGEAALATVRERFDQKMVIGKYLELFETVSGAENG